MVQAQAFVRLSGLITLVLCACSGGESGPPLEIQCSWDEFKGSGWTLPLEGRGDGPRLLVREDGTRVAEGAAAGGRPTGSWTVWHPNGVRGGEVTFEDGAPMVSLDGRGASAVLACEDGYPELVLQAADWGRVRLGSERSPSGRVLREPDAFGVFVRDRAAKTRAALAVDGEGKPFFALQRSSGERIVEYEEDGH